VTVNPDGSNASQEPFLTGFLDGNSKILGRPADIIVAPDGSLLVADDQSIKSPMSATNSGKAATCAPSAGLPLAGCFIDIKWNAPTCD
jgi:hypothetical protein